MNRDIRFRGKCPSKGPGGQWVYGCYVSSLENGTYIVCPDGDEPGVIPESVGQYTGLEDSNGKAIYEGDIIGITYNLGEPGADTTIHVVEWGGDYPAFEIEPTISEDCNGLQEALAVYHVEVIGNRFENPELLKGASQ